MFFFADGDSDNDSLTGPPGGGIRLAIYGARNNPHTGAYFSARWGEMELGGLSDSTRSISFGLALKKVWGQDGRRFRPGFAFDVGMIRTQNKDMAESDINFENDTYTGAELFPRFTLDLVAFNAGNFKMIVPFSVGVYVVPFAFMKLMDEPVRVTTMFTIVQPAMTIGIAFGS